MEMGSLAQSSLKPISLKNMKRNCLTLIEISFSFAVIVVISATSSVAQPTIALMYNFMNHPFSGGTYIDYSGSGGFNSNHFGNNPTYPWQVTSIGYDVAGPQAPRYGFTGSHTTLGAGFVSDQSAGPSAGNPSDPSVFWGPLMTFAV